MTRKEILFPLVLRPKAGHGLPILEVYRSHTTTHHGRYDSSGRVISPSQRPLPGNTHNIHKKQTSMPPAGFKPMIPESQRPQNHAWTARPLGSAVRTNGCPNYELVSIMAAMYQHTSHVTSFAFFFPREQITGTNTLRLLQTLFLTSWLERTEQENGQKLHNKELRTQH